jgi:hypothetical protein
VYISAGSSFREYVNKVIGRDIFDMQNEVRETGGSGKVFGKFPISSINDYRATGASS